MIRAAAAVVFFALFSLLTSPLSAAEIAWTNLAGGNWNTAANWSPNQVPTATDNAYITNAGTYTVTMSVSPTIGRLILGGGTSGTQTVSSSTFLTINTSCVVETNGAYLQSSSGYIQGAGEFLVKGRFDWLGGMQQAGSTIFTNTAQVTMGNGLKSLSRGVINYGSVLYSGGTFTTYSASWTNMPSAVFDIQGDGDVTYYSAISPPAIFNNRGLLRKSGGSGDCSMAMVVSNSGTILVSNGTLSLNAGGTSSGEFQANGSGTLHFGGGTQTLLAGAQLKGDGLIKVGGTLGTLFCTMPLTVTNRFELASIGRLSGTNTIVIAGPFNWTGGDMIGPGKTVFTNSAIVTITSGNQGTRTIDNYLNLTWTGPSLGASAGAVWNNLPGSLLQLQGTSFGNSGAAFNNRGTLIKSGASTLAFSSALTNNGNVTVAGGVLNMIGGGVSSGTFHAEGTNVVDFGGATHVLEPSAILSGPGVVRASGNLTIQSYRIITNSFELPYPGELGGTGTVVFAGTVNWTGGGMTNTGRTVFTNSAVVTIGSAIFRKSVLARAVDNFTNVRSIGSGTIDLGNGAVWNNMPGSVFDLQGTGNIHRSGATSAAFYNAGLLMKSGGSFSRFQVSVTNSNWVVLGSGLVSMEGGGIYVQTNGVTELAGGNFGGGGLIDIQAGLLTGAGNISNPVRNNGTNMPGSPFGFLSISNANYTNTAQGTFRVQLGGLTAGTNHDQMRVIGNAPMGHASLDGQLEVSTNAFAPSPGNIFTVMTFRALSGRFATSNLTEVDPLLKSVYLPTNLLLIVENAFPFMTFSVPSGSTQMCCQPFRLRSTALDLDGRITNVTFLVENTPVASIAGANLTGFTNLVEIDTPGTYFLQAQVTDDYGWSTWTTQQVTIVSRTNHVLSMGGIRSPFSFKFCMQGEEGRDYEVLANTNIHTPDWQAIGTMVYTNVGTNGIWRFFDTNASQFPHRFYQTRQLP